MALQLEKRDASPERQTIVGMLIAKAVLGL